MSRKGALGPLYREIEAGTRVLQAGQTRAGDPEQKGESKARKDF